MLRGQVDVAGETCVDPVRAIESDTPLSYCPDRPRPETMARRLKILYEDRHIMVVDKAAGVLTQPTPAREPRYIARAGRRLLARTRGMVKPYVGIVHRLDQATSGVILLVCSPRSLRPFQKLFREHAIERLYLAVVEGVIEPARGTIDLPLVANRGDGRRGAADEPDNGVPAVTHYERLGQFGAWPVRLRAGSRPGGRGFAFTSPKWVIRLSAIRSIAPCLALVPGARSRFRFRLLARHCMRRPWDSSTR